MSKTMINRLFDKPSTLIPLVPDYRHCIQKKKSAQHLNIALHPNYPAFSKTSWNVPSKVPFGKPMQSTCCYGNLQGLTVIEHFKLGGQKCQRYRCQMRSLNKAFETHRILEVLVSSNDTLFTPAEFQALWARWSIILTTAPRIVQEGQTVDKC